MMMQMETLYLLQILSLYQVGHQLNISLTSPVYATLSQRQATNTFNKLLM